MYEEDLVFTNEFGRNYAIFTCYSKFKRTAARMENYYEGLKKQIRSKASFHSIKKARKHNVFRAF